MATYIPQEKEMELKNSPMFQLSLSSKELFHSNFIAWLCERYPSVMSRVFKLDGEIEKVAREKDHIDIQLELRNGDLVIIENKVKSTAHDQQLEKYARKFPQSHKVLLTMTKPVLSEETLKMWDVLCYRKLAKKLKETVLPDVTDEYHKKLIEDYAEFVEKMSRLLRSATSFREDDKWLQEDYRDAMRELRIDDIAQKARVSKLASMLGKRLARREEDKNDDTPRVVMGKGFFAKDKETKHGDVQISYGYTRQDSLLDMKCVYSFKPPIALGIQLQGRQIRCVVETDGTSMDALSKFKEFKEKGWTIDSLTEGKRSFAEAKMRKEFCQYGKGFVYEYKKLSSETTVRDVLDVFVSGVRMFREMIKEA